MTERELLATMAASLATPSSDVDGLEGAVKRAQAILAEVDKVLPPEEERMPDEPPEDPEPIHPNGGNGPVMPFGKWKGLSLDWLAMTHPDYLEWALENMQRMREPLRNQIKSALRKHQAHV